MRWQELGNGPKEPSMSRKRFLAQVACPALAGLLALAGISVRPAGALPNPTLTASGALSVVVLMDRSASVGLSKYNGSWLNVVNSKAAATSFTRALSKGGCAASLAIVPFATAPVVAYEGQVSASNVSTIADRISKVPYIQSVNGYQSWTAPNMANLVQSAAVPSGYPWRTAPTPSTTNWEGALRMAKQVHDRNAAPDARRLTIVITDGEPAYNDSAPGTNFYGWDAADLTYAIQAADALKQSGSRIVAVQAGSDRTIGKYNGRTIDSEDTLRMISGPREGTDYYMSDYSDLTDVLTSISDDSCVLPPTTTTTFRQPPPPPPTTQPRSRYQPT